MILHHEFLRSACDADAAGKEGTQVESAHAIAKPPADFSACRSLLS